MFVNCTAAPVWAAQRGLQRETELRSQSDLFFLSTWSAALFSEFCRLCEHCVCWFASFSCVLVSLHPQQQGFDFVVFPANHNNNQGAHNNHIHCAKASAVWQQAGRMQQAFPSLQVGGGGSNSVAFPGSSSLACPHQQLPRSSSRQPHRCKHLPAAAAAAPGVQPPDQAAATAVLPAKQPLIRLSRRKRTLSWPRWERKLFETLLAVDQEQVRCRKPCVGRQPGTDVFKWG